MNLSFAEWLANLPIALAFNLFKVCSVTKRTVTSLPSYLLNKLIDILKWCVESFVFSLYSNENTLKRPKQTTENGIELLISSEENVIE